MDLDHFNDIIYASGNLQTSRDEERERTLLWHFVFCSPFFSVFSFFFFFVIVSTHVLQKSKTPRKEKNRETFTIFFSVPHLYIRVLDP